MMPGICFEMFKKKIVRGKIDGMDGPLTDFQNFKNY